MNEHVKKLREIADDADVYDRTLCNAILEVANVLEAQAAKPIDMVLETKTRGKNDSVLFDGPADVMCRLRAQAEFERGQQLDPDWGA